MHIRNGRTWILAAGLLLCLSITACRTALRPPPAASFPAAVDSLAVLPFKDMAAVYGENVNVRCALDGKTYTTGSVSEGAEKFLTDQLFGLITNRRNFQLVPPGHTLGVISKLIQTHPSTLSERDLLIDAGRTLGADAVVAGHVYRFRERAGRPYAVVHPASVTFDIHVVHVASGRILWHFKFEETQQSLDQNLLAIKTFFKRKGQWITAWQMAATGLEAAFETFPRAAGQ